ncbi:MAG: T9SS type A sorting domain-containing protein [Ignavibacteriae bacterium]|nr:T9SS type A sorting domain-containing protein [Ignavibacteriota bacterium]
MKHNIHIFKALMSIFMIALQAGATNFNTGLTTWSQPNSVTFTAKAWGDEHRTWMETQDGYRFVQGPNGWYYYATLDASGEFAPTSYRVGIDSPPASSYQLQRSAAREAEIDAFIAQNDSGIAIQAQKYKQLQAQRNAQGRPLTIKINVICVEFSDKPHYRDTIPPITWSNGYLKSDFEKMLFSGNNEWFDTVTTDENITHPENEPVFGSFRDYWDQMSLGKFQIQGRVVNPTNANGTPQWISFPQPVSFYYGVVNRLFDSSFARAVSYGWVSPTETPSDTLKYIILYAGNVIPSQDWNAANAFYGSHIRMSERKGPGISTLNLSFTHFGWTAHEFGHLIGFYDEYCGTCNGTDLFNYDLMAGGVNNGPFRKGACPASLSPYYRLSMGWIKPDTLRRDTTNYKVIYNYNSPKYYRIEPINRNIAGDEHFIFETRLRKGFDLYLPTPPDSFATQPGILLIWHHNSPTGFDGPYDRTRLIPADSSRSISFRTDFFPKDSITNRQSFNDLTVPQARHDYQTEEGFTNIQPAHFALNGIHRHRAASPSDSEYTVIDTIALKLTMAAGTITQNTTWSYDVRVVDNVTVQNGVTLTVLPGTNVRVDSGDSLLVNGKLVAKGSSTQRVTFTSSSATPAPGIWGGIVCSGGGPDTLTYCDIKYAETGIYFGNTAANSYMERDTVSQTLYSGVTVSTISTSSTGLKMYKCGLVNNRGRGLAVGNAKVTVTYSRIENNGAENIGPGIYVYAAGKLFLDSSRVQNNVGSGVDVTGLNSRVSFSADEIKRGYNTFYRHGLSEVYVRNSATAFLGYLASIFHCDCEQALMPGTPEVSAPCPPGCTSYYTYEPRGGWNNVYSTNTYSCRLINNATTTTVRARYTYWGTGSTMFCGSVDTTSQLGSPVTTPAKTVIVPPGGIVEALDVNPPGSKEMVDWLKQLRVDVEENAENAIDALHQLALYVGPGGDYPNALDIPWEVFLVVAEATSQSPQVRTLASALRVQTKMDQGDFQGASALADQILLLPTSDDLWFFLQTRKIVASVGMGDMNAAQTNFDAMRSRGEQIDPQVVEALAKYLVVVSGTGSSSSLGGNQFVKGSGTNVSKTPLAYFLDQNYPNPFNPRTTLRFGLPQDAFVTLKILNILGQVVATLADREEFTAGTNEVEFVAGNLPSGVYFYRLAAQLIDGDGALTSETFTSVKKMLLLR